MAVLTVTDLTVAGVAPGAAAAAVAGDGFTNDRGNIFVEVENTNGAQTRSVTFVAQWAGGSVPASVVKTNKTATIPATSRRLFGPFAKSEWNDTNGLVQMTYVDNTNLLVSVFRAPPA